MIRWEGHWGEWAASPEFCPEGSFVYGFKLQSEKKQGGSEDDSALNSIELHCRKPNSAFKTKSISSSKGFWGDWGSTAWCTSDKPVDGFKVQEEPKQGEDDDSSLNNIALYCKDETAAKHASVNTNWGSWKPVQRCPDGFAVVGLKTRVENKQGDGDDTALNGLELYCQRYSDPGTFDSINSQH